VKGAWKTATFWHNVYCSSGNVRAAEAALKMVILVLSHFNHRSIQITTHFISWENKYARTRDVLHYTAPVKINNLYLTHWHAGWTWSQKILNQRQFWSVIFPQINSGLKGWIFYATHIHYALQQSATSFKTYEGLTNIDINTNNNLSLPPSLSRPSLSISLSSLKIHVFQMDSPAEL
jgi:hypothetical protein